MLKDIVIGVDSSTTATKAIAWDRHGYAVAEGRASVPLSNPHPGFFEQDAADWWSAAATAISQVVAKVGADRIAAVAISNQRESFVALDEAGEPVRPGTLWLDERAKIEVKELAERFGGDRIHQVTGKPCDVTPGIYRLVWMKKHEPEKFARFRTITEVHAYLTHRLTGKFITSTASADPPGFLDMASMDHARDLMAEIGLNETQFPAIVRPGEVMGAVTETASRTTGLWAGTPVVAGGGDGQCAGTGVNVFAPGRAYVNMGTALVSGTYSRTYGINHAFRTMGAVSDEGYIFESVNRTGTFLVDWILRELFNTDPRLETTLFKTLEGEAALAGVGAGGMVLVPYWSGVMTPYWRTEARGIIAGLNASHKRGHIYRAMLDGLSLEQALATDKAAAAVGSPIDHYVAIGGGSTSDLWCSILADASGRTVVRSSTIEASSLGAAMAAAKGAGWYTTIEKAAASMAGEETRRFMPEEKTAKRYRALMAIYADLWPLLSDWNARLAAFADESGE